MYPTLTRYAGPAKAKIRFHKLGCFVSTELCTSSRDLLCGGELFDWDFMCQYFDGIVALSTHKKDISKIDLKGKRICQRFANLLIS
jgi:hypothetical protein